MSIVMNMSSYVIEELSTTRPANENDLKLAECQLPLQLAILQQERTLVADRVFLPASLSTVDIDNFLQKMSCNGS